MSEMINKDLGEVEGKVWKFGDKISTDLMMPGFSRGTGLERAKYCMRANRPGWSDQVQPGDIVVAGENFGCGSSRDATANLMLLGIKVVIAESMSRVFFRNSIASGLPVLIAPGIQDLCEEGEVLRIDFAAGRIKNIKSGKTLKFEPLPEDTPPMQILRAGGIMGLLEEEYLGKKK